jgi:hypothetical protein
MQGLVPKMVSTKLFLLTLLVKESTPAPQTQHRGHRRRRRGKYWSIVKIFAKAWSTETKLHRLERLQSNPHAE